jgi:hypothetical protein
MRVLLPAPAAAVENRGVDAVPAVDAALPLSAAVPQTVVPMSPWQTPVPFRH